MTEQELVETIAKWLFKNKHRLPNQRFYANWYDETASSPLTEKEYLGLANEILTIVKEALPELAKEAGYKSPEEMSAILTQFEGTCASMVAEAREGYVKLEVNK